MTKTTGMQTVKQAKSYYTKENYHQQNSEKGYFFSNSNQLMEFLGLDYKQEVTNETHFDLIEGFNPKNKEALANNSGTQNRRAGFDITTNSPKSFSLLCEFARANNQDDFLNFLGSIQREANLRMMNEATKYALTRLSDEKRTRINNIDVVWASFEHDTARVTKEGFIDPHEHTHNFMYNVVGYTDDNGNYKIASLENKQIMLMQKYLGNYYRNEMSKLLIENGFEIDLKNALDGEFEVKGFSKKQLDAFSNRGREVRADAQNLIDSGEVGTTNLQKAIEIARLKNYKAKTKIDRDELTSDNKIRLELEGINDEFISDLIDNSNVKELTEELKMEWLKKSHTSLASSKGIFTLEDLKMEFAKQSVHFGVSLDEVDDLIIKDDEIVKLDANQYTTTYLINAEKEIIFNCINNESFVIDTKKDRLEKYLKENDIEFTAGQKEACELVMTTNKQFVAIQGDAGSGKTFSLGTLKKVYQNEYDFVGLAPTGQASENIGKDANVEYKTIDSYILKEIERNEKPRIILLDETGMVDSIKLHKLIELAVANNDKVVLIGDTKQYASIGAGKIFEDLQKYGITKADVTENKRQETETLRTVVDNIKEKNVSEAIKNLDNNVIEVKNEAKLLKKIVETYNEDTVVLAPMNKQRNALNQLIREKRLSQNLISDDNSIEVAMYRSAKSNGVEKYSAKAYEIGQILSIDTTQLKGFKAGQKFTVVGIKDDDTLILDTISTNKTGRDRTRKNVEFNIKDNIDSVSIFSYDDNNKLKFAENEKIIFTKKVLAGKTAVPNGAMGTIKKIKGDNVTIALNNKKEVSFNLKDNPFLDYSYAITDYKSQGMSINRVLVLGDKMMANLNAFYVQVTRAKQDLKFFTTDLEGFKERAKNEQVKKSTLDYTMKEDFREKEKKSFDIYKKDLLEKVKEDREKIKFNIKGIKYGKSNNANVNENEHKIRQAGESKSSHDKLDFGTGQELNKLISTVSIAIRRDKSRWRKSVTGNVRENWRKYWENGETLGAVNEIKDIQTVLKIDKDKEFKTLLFDKLKLNLKEISKPILELYNNLFKKQYLPQKDIIKKIISDKKELDAKVKNLQNQEIKKTEKQKVATKTVSKKEVPKEKIEPSQQKEPNTKKRKSKQR